MGGAGRQLDILRRIWRNRPGVVACRVRAHHSRPPREPGRRGAGPSRGAGKRALRRHSRSAMASHCGDFSSAARTSPPAQPDRAPCWMRAFRPAAQRGSQPARHLLKDDCCRTQAVRCSGRAGADVSNDAVLTMCWYRFGQRPRQGAAEPGMAVRRRDDHPGAIGLPPTARLLPAQACTSPDAVVAAAGMTGRMFSRRRRCRRASHPARLCSPRWCGCRRAHG